MAEDLDIMKQRADLLQKARLILNNEYLKKKQETHTKWQQDSHQMWISQGILLPYPQSSFYPTESEIVAKALELYNALPTKKDEPDVKEEVVIPPELMPPVNPTPVIPLPPVKEPLPEEPEEMPPELKENQETTAQMIEEFKEQQLAEQKRRQDYLRSLLAQFITTAKELDAKTSKGTPEDDIQQSRT